MDPRMARSRTRPRRERSAEVIGGADVFLGLSAGGVLNAGMVRQMAPRPLILALANPTPEILPDEVHAARPDAVMATGRSDYPNQVNNVLCFPFIFRGALDVGATTINGRWRSPRCRRSPRSRGRSERYRGRRLWRRRGFVLRPRLSSSPNRSIRA
jgi:malic enzyme